MDSCIHPLSVIPFSDIPLPPPPAEAISLTPDSLWSWFLYSLGWHEPALPKAVIRNVRKRFESIPLALRCRLIRRDLLPHRVHPPDSFRVDELSISILYRITAAIRHLAVRSAHRLYRNPANNPVDSYADEHQLWLPEAELNWLRMREGMREAAEGKCIDFPISMRFMLCHPQRPTDPAQGRFGQMRIMTLDSRANLDGRLDDEDYMNGTDPQYDGFWPLQFHPPSHNFQNSMSSTISFSRSRNGLGIELPDSLGRLGRSWIENAIWGPKNRVLFQKECADKDVGILLWPSFPQDRHQTPRIPVYFDDVVELVDGDRLLIFVGPKRGLDDAVVQIDIECNWASQTDIRCEYADKKYVYPNPCERYPYCVQRPINRPTTTFDPLPLQEFVRPQSEFTATPAVEEAWRQPIKPRKSATRATQSKPRTEGASTMVTVEVLETLDYAEDSAWEDGSVIVDPVVVSPSVLGSKTTKRKRSDSLAHSSSSEDSDEESRVSNKPRRSAPRATESQRRAEEDASSVKIEILETLEYVEQSTTEPNVGGGRVPMADITADPPVADPLVGTPSPRASRTSKRKRNEPPQSSPSAEHSKRTRRGENIQE